MLSSFCATPPFFVCSLSEGHIRDAHAGHRQHKSYTCIYIYIYIYIFIYIYIYIYIYMGGGAASGKHHSSVPCCSRVLFPKDTYEMHMLATANTKLYIYIYIQCFFLLRANTRSFRVLSPKDTYEMHMLATANTKLGLEHAVMRTSGSGYDNKVCSHTSDHYREKKRDHLFLSIYVRYL